VQHNVQARTNKSQRLFEGKNHPSRTVSCMQ